MNRRKIIAVLALPLFALSLACGPDDTGDEPKPKPNDRNTAQPVERANCPGLAFRADYERCFQLQTFVETRLGPYDVYLKITGGNGVYPPSIPQSGGGWKHALVYRTGTKLNITLTLHYEGEQSKEGFCSITDGREIVKNKLKSITAGGGSPYEAVCQLETSQ